MTKDSRPINSQRRSWDWQPRQNSKHADRSKETADSSSNKIPGPVELKKTAMMRLIGHFRLQGTRWASPASKVTSSFPAFSPNMHSKTPIHSLSGITSSTSPSLVSSTSIHHQNLTAISTSSKGHVSSEPQSARARHGSPEPGQ